MINLRGSLSLAAVLSVVLISTLWADNPSQPVAFAVTDTFKLGGIGGWDYVKVSNDGTLLYVPRSSHTLVVDTATGKTVVDIPGTGKSHGVALVPAAGRGFVSDGKDGSVQVFDLKTNTVLGKVTAADDADGIIFDAASGKVFVACGDAGVLVPLSPDVNPVDGKADAAIDLGGKPEYLTTDGAGRVYVNLQDKDQVAVIDTKAMKVIAHWSTGPGGQPTGLAIDSDKGRLFVGCRNRKMIVMSVKDGSVLANLPIGRGVDATAFDHGLGFASCGDGTLTIIAESSPGKFEVLQQLKTAPGARTMAVDSRMGRLYLPTADMAPTTAPAKPNARPAPIAGTFKILVVSPTHP